MIQRLRGKDYVGVGGVVGEGEQRVEDDGEKAIKVIPPVIIRVATFITWLVLVYTVSFTLLFRCWSLRQKKIETRSVFTKLILLLKIPFGLLAALEQSLVTVALAKNSRRKATRLRV